MKKTILALLLTGGSMAVWAQDTQDTTKKPITDTTRRDSTDTSSRVTSGNYNAYGSAVNIPITVQQSFQNTYPDAADARWEQSNNMWRVHYKSNGQDMNMYYGANGQGYLIALPVLENQVPEEVVNKVKEMHGTNIYDITALRANDSSEIYQVRLVENGALRTERINADGSAAADITITNNNMDQNNGMNQMHDSTGNQMHQNMNQNMNNNTGIDSTNNMRMDSTNNMRTDSTGNNGTMKSDSSSTGTGTTIDNTNAASTDSSANTSNNDNSGNNTTGTAGSEMNTTNPTNGNDGKLKIKTESSDGTETKVKVEKGEVKVKKD